MGRNRIVNSHQSIPFNVADVAAPAANNAAVITYAAFPGPVGVAAVGNQPIPAGYPVPPTVAHVITGFRASVTATATISGTPHVTIQDGSNTVYDQYLTTEPYITGVEVTYSLDVKFTLPKRGTAGNSMTITLSNPGSGNTAKLAVYEHWTELN